MSPTFSIGIPHTPWVPERVASKLNLQMRLDENLMCGEEGENGYCQWFTEREPNHAWSERMWVWAADQNTSHFLQLQDDVILQPHFAEGLEALVEAYPNEVIGLHCNHPAAKALYADRRHVYTSTDAMVGTAYVIPTDLLKEFLVWREGKLVPGAVQSLNEDTLIGLWCMVTGRRIYHPIPSLIDHDVSIKSTYGNDDHPFRRPEVLPTRSDIEAWAHPTFWREADVRHVGRMYGTFPELAKMWVKGVTDSDVVRWVADDGVAEARRLTHVVKANSAAPKVSVLVCTPTRGGVAPEYAASIWRLLKSEMCDVTAAFEIADVQLWHEDVVRVRNRFVSYFLRKTNCTHLLFVDSDVSFAPECIAGMIRANVDFVAAPYPRRDVVDFERVRTETSIPSEAAAYRYSVQINPNVETISVSPEGLVEIEGIGLGCALLSRTMLNHMQTRTGRDYTDVVPGEGDVLTADLFRLRSIGAASFEEPRPVRMLSEDYSFCHYARALGYKVHMYLGPGSPVNHHGTWGFKGAVEAFGLQRVKV